MTHGAAVRSAAPVRSRNDVAQYSDLRDEWWRPRGAFAMLHWIAAARAALVPQATRADRKRIKELERELLRKDRALAETAALLVLSKKLGAIFHKGGDE